MPIFFTNLAVWLASFLGTSVKKSAFRIASFIAFAAVVAVLVVALFGAVFLLLSGVSTTVPATASMVWGWVMPVNATLCFTTILSARILRAVYDFKVQLMLRKHQAV